MEELQEAMKTNMIMAARTKTALTGLFSDLYRAVDRCKSAFTTTKEIVTEFISDEHLRTQVYREQLHSTEDVFDFTEPPSPSES